MNTFINDTKKLFATVLKSDNNGGEFSEKSIDSAIKTSRAIKCCKETKDFSYYVSKFNNFDFDKREFIRLLIELSSKNNLKSQNIDIIMNYIRLFESYFIYLDVVKLYYGDGLIYLDIYRENKFPKRIFNKKDD